jgi:acyl dehydratase
VTALELTEGAQLPPRRFGPISRTDIVRYQGASGDFNPIHHDEPFARGAGYPSVISVGMLQAGFVGSYCAELAGPESVRELRVRFRDTVFPGDELEVSGTVERVEEEGGERRVRIAIVVARGGDAVLTGEAVLAPS